MINGIININKEKGYTSHDVVAKMRGILRIKKIGHTGTLDPEAEGVLPICIGSGTKLVDMLTDKDKTYETVLKLGITTDTQDITGKVIKTSDVFVNYNKIEEVITSFVGEYNQLPPMYSAIKVNGRKLYELARQGIEIDRDRRKVIITDIRIQEYYEKLQEIKMTVDCGKGTYIRTLLHDMGEVLGCGGTMKSLVRTRVGSFKLEDALKLNDVEALLMDGKLESYVHPVDALFVNYQKINVRQEYHKLIYNGNIFKREHTLLPEQTLTSDSVRVYDENDTFIGIYLYRNEDEIFKPVKMFLS